MTTDETTLPPMPKSLQHRVQFSQCLLIQCFQLSLATFVVLLLLNVFSCKTVIVKAFILKLGENVDTSFIFSLANFGRSSLNGYVVITTK